MACGSGKLIADQVTGYRPEIRTDGLDVSRYQKVSAPRTRLVTGEETA